MILTLAWKEVREHQGIWLTMVFMTVILGTGLARLVAAQDAVAAVAVATLTILGMAAAYGVVCGAMMFAGENEGGTLVFLDIFSGRRGLLWTGKFAIGVALALTQGLAVALALRLLKQEPPTWVMAVVGGTHRIDQPGRVLSADLNVWFLVLPVVVLEAYAWGLLGSSLAQRVLAGAAVAACFVTPVWLLAIVAPAQAFFVIRLAATAVILAFSYSNFLGQSREPTPGPPPAPEQPRDPRDQFIELWEEFVREDELLDEEPIDEAPVRVSVAYSTAAPVPVGHQPMPFVDTPSAPPPVRVKPAPAKSLQARSPSEVLWWLLWEQAWPILLWLAAASLVIGFIIPANLQILWPLATLLLGVACGVAAFAPEQRDLSYQFLSAQHFPLRTIWRAKIFFWLAIALLGSLVLVVGSLLRIVLLELQRRDPPVDFPGGFGGSLRDLMGPMLFYGVWLIYGFCAGQVCVWYCRKNILALLVSTLVAAAALGMWLPSLLCGGMGGWQLWVPPGILLLATWFLMRAWAADRIKDRKPLVALAGFGAVAVLWAVLNFGLRAWGVPDVGAPIDPVAFRAELPVGKDNPAGKAINQAITRFDEPGLRWLASLEEAARLPVGVIEMPRADGQSPGLKHLPVCQKMTVKLLNYARAEESGPAFEHLAQILALSRNLRNKAPLESYLAGVQAEEDALTGLDQWLARGKPSSKQLRRVLDELTRHANETPPPLDCVQTECFRSGGLVANPNAWTFAAPGEADRLPERWLAGSIALSLDTPWEAERKTRIWQLTWAGLFRAIETPAWELPNSAEIPRTKKKAAQRILDGWLPAAEGPSAAITRDDMVRLLDASWLADERLFCSVTPLRNAATRARWRVDATRLVIALSLFRMEEGKAEQNLQDVVAKYLPAGLPIDPYSGQSFRYRMDLENPQGIIWSTGPDRIDHGGRFHGANLVDDDPRWPNGVLDLISNVPHWP